MIVAVKVEKTKIQYPEANGNSFPWECAASELPLLLNFQMFRAMRLRDIYLHPFLVNPAIVAAWWGRGGCA
jgi:hypothetical protein